MAYTDGGAVNPATVSILDISAAQKDATPATGALLTVLTSWKQLLDTSDEVDVGSPDNVVRRGT
jgi:hypothetical protein